MRVFVQTTEAVQGVITGKIDLVCLAHYCAVNRTP